MTNTLIQVLCTSVVKCFGKTAKNDLHSNERVRQLKEIEKEKQYPNLNTTTQFLFWIIANGVLFNQLILTGQKDWNQLNCHGLYRLYENYIILLFDIIILHLHIGMHSWTVQSVRIWILLDNTYF